MILAATLLGIVTVFAMIAALEIYLNSNALQQLKSFSRRLERLELFLGEDSANDHHLEWTPRGTLRGPTGLEPGSQLPSLELFTASGTKVTLDSLIGAPTLLLFLSTRCSACIDLFSSLLDYLDSAPLPLKIPSTVVTISGNTLDPGVAENGTEGIRILQALADDEVNRGYGVASTPCAVLLDDRGVVCDAAYIANIEELFAAGRRARDFVAQKSDLPPHADTHETIHQEKPKLPGTIRQRVQSIFAWMGMIVALLIVSALIVPIHVNGESMKPTLSNSTWILVSPLATAFVRPTRDTIIILRYPYLESLYLIKRVVALPGDCIAIRDGAVYINGHRQSEPFVYYHAQYTMPQQCLTSNEYYVLGDNRPSSFDSSTWGSLPKQEIAGVLVIALSLST